MHYLYYFYMVCALKTHDHMFFWNILQSPDLIMWYGLLKIPILFIVLSHYMSWDCELTVQMHEKFFLSWGSYNIAIIITN